MKEEKKKGAAKRIGLVGCVVHAACLETGDRGFDSLCKNNRNGRLKHQIGNAGPPRKLAPLKKIKLKEHGIVGDWDFVKSQLNEI